MGETHVLCLLSLRNPLEPRNYTTYFFSSVGGGSLQNAFYLALSKTMSKKSLKEKIIDFFLFFCIILKRVSVVLKVNIPFT